MSAYWIAHVTIHNMEQYQGYMALAPAAFEKYAARFIARRGESQTLEGHQFQRHIVIEFADLATARACYDSAEYQLARAARAGCADVMISIVEGLN